MPSRHLTWLLPLLTLAIFVPYSTDLDLAVSGHYFYDGHFNPSKFNVFLYNWGEYPGFVAGGLAILISALSFVRPSMHSWRPAAAAIALAYVVGPGILINGVFKEFWGRPRPVQIQQFGGKGDYLPFYKPEFANQGYSYKSFPSGHASMGFFFFVVALVGRREKSPSSSGLGSYSLSSLVSYFQRLASLKEDTFSVTPWRVRQSPGGSLYWPAVFSMALPNPLPLTQHR